MECRGCHRETGDEVLVDLGMQPLANSLWNGKDVMEPRYPLAPVICKNKMCRLIQLPELPDGVGFGADYPYRSGQSESWKEHLRGLSFSVMKQKAAVGTVIEIGGNDGTLGALLEEADPAIGYTNIDPSAPGHATNAMWTFMDREIGEFLGPIADWVVANNVMAHVPDLDDFLAGIRAVMKDDGLLTVEVQDVNQLIERGEWDCI